MTVTLIEFVPSTTIEAGLDVNVDLAGTLTVKVYSFVPIEVEPSRVSTLHLAATEVVDFVVPSVHDAGIVYSSVVVP